MSEKKSEAGQQEVTEVEAVIVEAGTMAEGRGNDGEHAGAADKPPHPLASLALSFIRRVNDMRLALRIAVPATADHFQAKAESYKKKFEPHIIERDGKGFTVKVEGDVRLAIEVKAALDGYKALDPTGAIHAIERSLFIGLFSEFDAFMGSLLELIYTRKPELFNEIKREISLSDLLQFGSIDAVRRDMLEKEIDSFRRDSYIDQFGALEKKFNIKTLRKFREWASFVELGQRRNLMTHNGGAVTDHYLSICEREGYSFKERPVTGSKLEIGPQYFFMACGVLSSVAFMLLYTLWRKLFPSEVKEANSHIQGSVYELLVQKHWGLAARLGDFSLSEEMRKGADDLDVRIRHINLAIAQNRCKLREEMLRTLDSCDWSACVRDFKLAIAVLKGENERAASLMRDIGKEGEMVNQWAYHRWPLFFEFVKTEEFQRAYRDVYGHDFSPEEVAEGTTVAVVDAGTATPSPSAGALANTEAKPLSAESDQPRAEAGSPAKDSVKRVRRTRKAKVIAQEEINVE